MHPVQLSLSDTSRWRGVGTATDSDCVMIWRYHFHGDCEFVGLSVLQ